MVREGLGTRHPEGLTEAQESLADALLQTRVEAVIRGRKQEPGGYSFYTTTMHIPPIAFAGTAEDLFAVKSHEQFPGMPLTKVYLRLGGLPEPVRRQAGQVMAGLPVTNQPDYCVGVPHSGVSLAHAYGEASELPAVDMLEKIETRKGRQVKAKKDMGGKGTVVLIDDVATDGESKLEAIRALRLNGYQVHDAVILVDREQGASDQLAAEGVRLHAVFTLRPLLQYYVRTGRISYAMYYDALGSLTAMRQYVESQTRRR